MYLTVLIHVQCTVSQNINSVFTIRHKRTLTQTTYRTCTQRYRNSSFKFLLFGLSLCTYPPLLFQVELNSNFVALSKSRKENRTKVVGCYSLCFSAPVAVAVLFCLHIFLCCYIRLIFFDTLPAIRQCSWEFCFSDCLLNYTNKWSCIVSNKVLQ